MSTPEQEALEARHKRTVWLLAGAAASLILPLIGAVYIRMSESQSRRGPNPSVMFDRREAGETKINVAQTGEPGAKATPPAPTEAGAGSSLSFVKGNGDYSPEKTAEAPKTSTPLAAAAVATPAPILPKTVAKKNAKKPFIMPKLQGVKGFKTFKGSAPKRTDGQ